MFCFGIDLGTESRSIIRTQGVAENLQMNQVYLIFSNLTVIFRKNYWVKITQYLDRLVELFFLHLFERYPHYLYIISVMEAWDTLHQVWGRVVAKVWADVTDS